MARTFVAVSGSRHGSGAKAWFRKLEHVKHVELSVLGQDNVGFAVSLLQRSSEESRLVGHGHRDDGFRVGTQRQIAFICATVGGVPRPCAITRDDKCILGNRQLPHTCANATANSDLRVTVRQYGSVSVVLFTNLEIIGYP